MERQQRGSFRAFVSRRWRGTPHALSFPVALTATLCKLPAAEFAICGHGCEDDCIARSEFKASCSRRYNSQCRICSFGRCQEAEPFYFSSHQISIFVFERFFFFPAPLIRPEVTSSALCPNSARADLIYCAFKSDEISV